MVESADVGLEQAKSPEPGEKTHPEQAHQEVSYDDPFKWSNSRKWLYTVLTALCTLTATLCSSIFSATITVTAKEFHTTETVMLLGVSLFVLGR